MVTLSKENSFRNTFSVDSDDAYSIVDRNGTRIHESSGPARHSRYKSRPDSSFAAIM